MEGECDHGRFEVNFRRNLLQNVKSLVGGSVVDDDHFHGPLGLVVEGVKHPPDRLFLVPDRNHYAQVSHEELASKDSSLGRLRHTMIYSRRQWRAPSIS